MQAIILAAGMGKRLGELTRVDRTHDRAVGTPRLETDHHRHWL